MGWMVASSSALAACPLQKTELAFRFSQMVRRRMAARGKHSHLLLLLLIIKRGLTCCVNASITFDTIISDLSSWVKTFSRSAWAEKSN